MYPAGTGLVTQGRALKLDLRACKDAASHRPRPLWRWRERPLLSNVKESTLGRGEQGLWAFITIWNVNKGLWAWEKGGILYLCGLSLSVALKGLDRAGTQKSRNGCLPATPATYTTKEGFRCI